MTLREQGLNLKTIAKQIATIEQKRQRAEVALIAPQKLAAQLGYSV